MVTRIGHMSLQVENLDESVSFFVDTLGLKETLRESGRSFLTCNDRHHELVLVDGSKPGYEHVALEVPDADALKETVASAVRAGGKDLGPAAPEPGVAGGHMVAAPTGHRFKLFYGMEKVEPPPPDPEGVRPSRFEHVSLKVVSMGKLERFLEDGFGFRFSDRAGSIASWWHCDEDHHGIALTRAPKNELHHHAWKVGDLSAMGAIADRAHDRGRALAWGIGHHGPGDNRFMYFKDPTGALVECCSGMAQMGPGSTYVPRKWPIKSSGNLWGAGPPPKFLLAGTPLVAG